MQGAVGLGVSAVAEGRRLEVTYGTISKGKLINKIRLLYFLGHSDPEASSGWPSCLPGVALAKPGFQNLTSFELGNY